MASKHLATYLNDHLAGSVTAIEMLGYVATAYAGTDVERFATQLRGDVIADRKELEGLMARLNIGQSSSRKASAWLAEKFAQLKLRMDDPAGGSFRLLEAVEAISLGIEGKHSLWRALGSLAATSPEFRMLDYERLKQRAVEQRSRVEVVRLEAASASLAEGS